MIQKFSNVRLVIVLLAASGVGQATARQQQPERSTAEPEILARAERIHREALTIDTHVDIAGAQYATEKLDPGIDHPELKCDLVKMARGDIDAVFLAVWVEQGKRDAEGYKVAYDAAIGKFDAIRRLAKVKYPDRCELALTPNDVERIVASGKRAVMIGIENGYPIGTDLANVKKFYDLGTRYITLSHNGHNQICDSCLPSAALGDRDSEHDGLSPFGRQVVAEMNRLGIMIDVSHIGPQSFQDVIETSREPVIASHAGCRALQDHPRNLDDEQLKALAKNGGVIQIVAVASFLKAPSPERRRAINELANKLGIAVTAKGPNLKNATPQQRDQFQEGMKEVTRQYPPATLKDFVDHLDHAVKVAGIDHVGIGSDFDGGGGVAGFDDHSESRNITVELVRRGYSDAAIKKIWGGNLLRVWRAVEK